MHLGLNDAWNYHINYKNVKILISIEVTASFVKKMSSVKPMVKDYIYGSFSIKSALLN